MEGEEYFSFEQRPARSERPWIHTGLNVLLIVVAVVVVGGLLWMRVGPKPAPCNGAPPGTLIEDPHHPGSFAVCKG